MLFILQFSTVLTASLYELQLISLIVTNPYSKSGFFEISLSESSDEDLLSSLVSADAETCMISTSSVQKSTTVYHDIARCVLQCAFFFQKVTIRCICLN